MSDFEDGGHSAFYFGRVFIQLSRTVESHKRGDEGTGARRVAAEAEQQHKIKMTKIMKIYETGGGPQLLLDRAPCDHHTRTH